MQQHAYLRGFLPYALAAFLIGTVGGFSTVLGPAFVQDMGIAYQNTTWTTLAQALSTATGAPILGKLGDAVGRKKMLLGGMVIFTLGNLLSAGAMSLVGMLPARFLVGIGTAAMAPVILAYILTEFPKEKLASGFSLYMLISSASVVAGPTLGALAVAAWGWRGMQGICVGICLAVLIVCALTFREKSAPRQPLRHFDGWGAGMAVLFFGLLLCLPALGQNFGWDSPYFLGALLLCVPALLGLLYAEKRATQPVLSGRLLKRRTFLLSVGILFLTQGLMQANMTNAIVFVNYTHPESGALSGYAVSVLYLGMSLGAVWLGNMADRKPTRTVLTGSLLLTAVACASMLLYRPDTGVGMLMASLGLLGLSLGGNGTVLMKVALSGLPPWQAAAGTGTYGLFRDLAAPFGVAVLVPLFTNRVTELTGQNIAPGVAAAEAMHRLAVVELICVGLGILAVRLLPAKQERGE